MRFLLFTYFILYGFSEPLLANDDSLSLNLSYFYYSHTESTPEVTRDSSGVLQTGENKFKRVYSILSFSSYYKVLPYLGLGLEGVEGTRTTVLRTTVNSQVTTEVTKTRWKLLGPSIGYDSANGVSFGVSYFPYNSRETSFKLDDGDHYSVLYDKGLAWAAHLGYGFKFTNLYFGPRVQFIHIDYKRVRASGQESEELNLSEADDFIVPSLSFWWKI